MLLPLALEITSRLLAVETLSALSYFLLLLLVFGALSLLAGTLMHFTIEKSFLILKDRIRL